jgi:hypothetical protein
MAVPDNTAAPSTPSRGCGLQSAPHPHLHQLRHRAIAAAPSPPPTTPVGPRLYHAGVSCDWSACRCWFLQANRTSEGEDEDRRKGMGTEVELTGEWRRTPSSCSLCPIMRRSKCHHWRQVLFSDPVAAPSLHPLLLPIFPDRLDSPTSIHLCRCRTTRSMRYPFRSKSDVCHYISMSKSDDCHCAPQIFFTDSIHIRRSFAGMYIFGQSIQMCACC